MQKKRLQNWGQLDQEYFPCSHKDLCKNCSCVKSRHICEKFCLCQKSCKYKFQGCKCLPGQCTAANNCTCVIYNRECDPDLCKHCKSFINLRNLLINPKYRGQNGRLLKIPHCNNTCMMYNVKKRLLIGKSTICNGLGLYSGQYFKKDDFVGEYIGEILTYTEAERRDVLCKAINSSYTFNITTEKVLDSYLYGNKLRFVNHGKFGFENLFVKIKLVQGMHRVGMYALKEIHPGDELFFDYGDKFNVDYIKQYNQTALKMRKHVGGTQHFKQMNIFEN